VDTSKPRSWRRFLKVRPVTARGSPESLPCFCTAARVASGSNPIEQAFSKIKNILRKLGARTHEALLEAMEEVLCKVTPADATGWFGHCGYQVEVQHL
jgi:hypothetical protein